MKSFKRFCSILDHKKTSLNRLNKPFL